MTKRLVDIDDDVLAEARRALGTTTIKDTVTAALRDATRAASRRSVDLASLGRFAEASRDLRDPKVMSRAWE